MTTPDGAAALVLARLQTLTAFGHFDGAVPIGIAAESPHTIYYPSPAQPMANLDTSLGLADRARHSLRSDLRAASLRDGLAQNGADAACHCRGVGRPGVDARAGGGVHS